MSQSLKTLTFAAQKTIVKKSGIQVSESDEKTLTTKFFSVLQRTLIHKCLFAATKSVTFFGIFIVAHLAVSSNWLVPLNPVFYSLI